MHFYYCTKGLYVFLNEIQVELGAHLINALDYKLQLQQTSEVLA